MIAYIDWIVIFFCWVNKWFEAFRDSLHFKFKYILFIKKSLGIIAKLCWFVYIQLNKSSGFRSTIFFIRFTFSRPSICICMREATKLNQPIHRRACYKPLKAHRRCTKKSRARSDTYTNWIHSTASSSSSLMCRSL